MSQTEDNPFEFDHPLTESYANEDWYDLEHILITNQGASNELAIYDADGGDPISKAWVSALEGDFVALAEAR